MTAMTEQAERYDRIATGYARWWAPIIAPQAVGVLAQLEPAPLILNLTGTSTSPLIPGLACHW